MLRSLNFCVIAICAASALAQNTAAEVEPRPMDRFQPFVGRWRVEHKLWKEPGSAPETFEGTAEIYFVTDRSVLVVDETTADKRYRFVGFHTYDANTKKFVNWTASSKLVLAWSEASWDQSRVAFRTRRLNPVSGQVDPLIGEGIWHVVTPDRHVFTATRVGRDGKDIPFKQEIYSRLD